MLTVKHVEKSGHESIQQCQQVSFFPKGYDLEGVSDRPIPRLEAFGCTGRGGAVDISGWCQYGDGTVYVMNEHGSTVAKYHLN